MALTTELDFIELLDRILEDIASTGRPLLSREIEAAFVGCLSHGMPERDKMELVKEIHNFVEYRIKYFEWAHPYKSHPVTYVA